MLIERLRSSTQVALKAREVLIACQMPSYEERKSQMEAILKSSISNSVYGEHGPGVRYSPHNIISVLMVLLTSL